MSDANAIPAYAALTPDERAAIDNGRWFSSLSPPLRLDILRAAYVRRYKDGTMIAARDDPAEAWMACARGAVQVSSTSLSGKQVTLTYVEPGVWFGDMAIVDGDPRTHDSRAHGETTLVCVWRNDLRRLLDEHAELTHALLRLYAHRIRQLYGLVEDLNTLPLRTRLAKQLLHLARSYRTPERDGEVRIGLQLAQEELGQLLGSSRQRVNQELKSLERQGLIRIETAGIVVCDRDGLMQLTAADG